MSWCYKRYKHIVGEVVEGGDGVTTWQYVCRAYCPATGESLYSEIVRIRVAKATTNECSFPKFKVGHIYVPSRLI